MTRTKLTLITLMLAAIVAAAQELPASQVPAVVQQAFHTKFPNVKQVAWKLKALTYDAEFVVNGAEVTVKLIETQDMQRADDSRLQYEIHLENGKEVLKVMFHADGTVISQSAKPKAPAKKTPRSGLERE